MRIIAMCLLTLSAWTLHAAPDIEEEHVHIDAVAELFARYMQNDGTSLRDLLAPDSYRALLLDKETLHELVHTFRDETSTIISEAVLAGATAETIAYTCQPDLDVEQVTSIVSTALGENVESDPILEQCLRVVPPEDLVNLIMTALIVLDPQDMELHMALMLDIMEDDGLDGSAILVSSLLQGDFLASDAFGSDCTGECLRPLAEQLVGDIAGDSSDTPTVQDEIDVGLDLDDDEPSLSNS